MKNNNKNLIIDTNVLIYLYEYNYNKRKSKEVDVDFLNNLVKSNNCYITSVTINELLFRFYEENDYVFEPSKKKFDSYMNFIDKTFTNTNWYINDSVSPINIDELRNITEIKYKDILQNKRTGEADYLYRIITNLYSSFINAYEEFLGRKIDKSFYTNFAKDNTKKIKNKIEDIIEKRYSNKEYTNEDAKADIDKCLYESISYILKYLSCNYYFTYKEIQTWNTGEQKQFIDTLDKINNNNISYNNLEIFIKKMKFSKYKDEEGAEAIFIDIFDSPDYKIIEPTKRLFDKGALYIGFVCKRIKKQAGGEKFKSKIVNEMNDFFNYIKINSKINYTSESESYFKFLLEELLNNSRRLDKNDVNDFLIVTAPGYTNLNDVTVISYDKNIEKFLKEQNKYYDEDVYNKLRINKS